MNQPDKDNLETVNSPAGSGGGVSGSCHVSRAPAPHGTRARYNYIACRCDSCRAAHAAYARERRRRKTPMVEVNDIAVQIETLSKQGIGTRAIADATGLDRHAIQWIKKGRVQRVHSSTAQRILAVDQQAIADHATIPIAPTCRLIRGLVEDGYTRKWIARQLGYRGGGLPFLYTGSRRLSALNASKVERLCRLIAAGRIAR